MSSDGCQKHRARANDLRSRLSSPKSRLLFLCYVLLELMSGLILALNPRLITGNFLIHRDDGDAEQQLLPAYASMMPTSEQTMSSEDGGEIGAAAAVALPPLEELIDANGTIIGDISWMLDFAIIAFPKAGTTFLKDYLNQTHETHVHERELCMKRSSDVADFVRRYHALHVRYDQPRYPKTVKFGLKCSGVFYRADDIHFYERYFPDTKLIIGLRHPVSWFENFYNYQSYRNVTLPADRSQLIGGCTDHRKVCTDRGRVHATLARLGTTPMVDDEEIRLLYGLNHHNDDNDGGGDRKVRRRRIQQQQMEVEGDHDGWHPQHDPRLLEKQTTSNGLPNDILLYEVRQLHDEDASIELSKDLRSYLGIRQHFPRIDALYQQNKTRAINICDQEHDEVRRVLVQHGADAMEWIRRYFLKSSETTGGSSSGYRERRMAEVVEVAAPDSFHRYLGDWDRDPCSSSRHMDR